MKESRNHTAPTGCQQVAYPCTGFQGACRVQEGTVTFSVMISGGRCDAASGHLPALLWFHRQIRHTVYRVFDKMIHGTGKGGVSWLYKVEILCALGEESVLSHLGMLPCA